MPFLFSFALSFLVGSIPTGYLAGKYLKQVDLREHGSGNVGATNAVRVLGKKLGILVFILDLTKGILAATLPARLFYPAAVSADLNIWIGFGAILGHIFTPFLKFKGGKGIATGAGVICGTFPYLFLSVILTWLVAFLISRIVSLSSLLALAALSLGCFFFEMAALSRFYFILISLLGVWTHRENITRLLQGEEKKPH